MAATWAGRHFRVGAARGKCVTSPWQRGACRVNQEVGRRCHGDGGAGAVAVACRRAVGRQQPVPAGRSGGHGGAAGSRPPGTAAGRAALPAAPPRVPGALPAQPRGISPLLPHLGLHRPVPGSATLQLPGSDCDLGDWEDPGRGHWWEKSCGRNAAHRAGSVPVCSCVLREQQNLTRGTSCRASGTPASPGKLVWVKKRGFGSKIHGQKSWIAFPEHHGGICPGTAGFLSEGIFGGFFQDKNY